LARTPAYQYSVWIGHNVFSFHSLGPFDRAQSLSSLLSNARTRRSTHLRLCWGNPRSEPCKGSQYAALRRCDRLPPRSKRERLCEATLCSGHSSCLSFHVRAR
jgi:hypothetical protein